MKAKKYFKFLAVVLGIVLISAIVFLANIYMGNPFDLQNAENAAMGHVLQNYQDISTDYFITFSDYNGIKRQYGIGFETHTSMDKRFIVFVDSQGNIVNDSYTHEVASGYNTLIRISNYYSRIVWNSVNEIYDETLSFNTGSIRLKPLSEQNESTYGIDSETLVIDETYSVEEIKEFSLEGGRVVLYCGLDGLTFEKAVETFLKVYDTIEQAGVAFYTMNLNISPWESPNRTKPIEQPIYFEDILYSEIDRNDVQKTAEYLKTKIVEDEAIA